MWGEFLAIGPKTSLSDKIETVARIIAWTAYIVAFANEDHRIAPLIADLTSLRERCTSAVGLWKAYEIESLTDPSIVTVNYANVAHHAGELFAYWRTTRAAAHHLCSGALERRLALLHLEEEMLEQQLRHDSMSDKIETVTRIIAWTRYIIASSNGVRRLAPLLADLTSFRVRCRSVVGMREAYEIESLADPSIATVNYANVAHHAGEIFADWRTMRAVAHARLERAHADWHERVLRLEEKVWEAMNGAPTHEVHPYTADGSDSDVVTADTIESDSHVTTESAKRRRSQ